MPTPANTRKGLYTVKFDTTDLGGVDDVKFNISLLLTPSKIGSIGKMKLDDWVDGVGDDSSVTVLLKEPTRANIELLSSWSATGNTLSGMPLPGVKMQQYAKALVFHPTDVAAGTTTQDVTIYKVVPDPSSVQQRNRNNQAEDVWEVRFKVYPDLTKLLAGTENPYWKFGT